MERSPRPAKPDPGRAVPQQIFLQEAKARLDAALTAQIGFAERLAWFWSNHFCISADKGPLRAIVGAYEREAIRPHVAGRFADMLLAVESHPGMLIYLDNARSIGPESIAGRNRGKGLNENLAREILELHTLGVRTVYTQDDVTRFAAVITGWTVVPPREPGGGVFVFNPRMHEPGAQTVLGRTFPDGEFDQGRAVLAMLARHPATAQHIAAKLVRHFVSDQPVPALADKLAKRFIATDGDLKQVAIALVTAPEAWNPAARKLKRPGEWIVASLRAAGVTPPEIGPVMQAQNMLGEPLWRPAAPKGFADEDAAWIDGLAQRLDVSNQMARRVAGLVDPAAAVETGSGAARLRGDADRDPPRREQAPGFDASLHGTGISAEMTMRNLDALRPLHARLHAPSRRELLLASGVLFAWAHVPRVAMAEGRDPRLLVVVLRGALDGLAAVAPVGDPDYQALRGDKVLRPRWRRARRCRSTASSRSIRRCRTCTGFMPPARRASCMRSRPPTASAPISTARTCSKAALPPPVATDTGWLNRALSALEPGGRVEPGNRKAFAVGPVTPLVVRGPAPVLSWTPPRLQPAGEDTLMRLLDLYRHTDAALARALEERIGLAAIARAGGMETEPQPGQPRPAGAQAGQVRAYFAESAGSAAKFMARPDGPRVGALAFDGWDTHADEGAVNGRLAALLGALDGAMAAIETGMGAAWRDTVVAIVTEFGRTARINGTEGTDHGTATIALLAGGAVKGGRVIADWPGLKTANLRDQRDLKPTTDLRAVIKGVLRDHLRVPDDDACRQGVSGQHRCEAIDRPRGRRHERLRRRR